jgi:acyl-CoA synthetase (AMP-forming)/AMP-acid ligase II
MNITDPIRHRARVSPRAVAIVRADDSSVSYEELDQIVDAAAARVDGTSLAAGQVAGLAIGGADEFPPLVLALALARAGIASAETSLPARHLDAVFTPDGTSVTTIPAPSRSTSPGPGPPAARRRRARCIPAARRFAVSSPHPAPRER